MSDTLSNKYNITKWYLAHIHAQPEVLIISQNQKRKKGHEKPVTPLLPATSYNWCFNIYGSTPIANVKTHNSGGTGLGLGFNGPRVLLKKRKIKKNKRAQW